MKRIAWVAACLLVFAATASAQNVYWRSNAPIRVTFQGSPDVSVVPGSNVYLVQGNDQGYDMFRYGGMWYLYDNGNWYQSGSYQGVFHPMDPAMVPDQVMNVPSSNWRNYPSDEERMNWSRMHDGNWNNGNWNGNNGNNSTWNGNNSNWNNGGYRSTNWGGPVITFRHTPHVTRVSGTHVFLVRDNDQDNDMFRYRGDWYVYQNGDWYRASDYRGPYRLIDVSVVPDDILNVPAGNWRHYPGGMTRPAMVHGRYKHHHHHHDRY